MCMEDIRIGRKSRSSLRTLSVGNTSIELVSTSPNRIALTVGPPPISAGGVDFVTITDGSAAVSGAGLTIPEKSLPLQMTLENSGNFVTKAMQIIASAAGPFSIGVLEVFLEEQ